MKCIKSKFLSPNDPDLLNIINTLHQKLHVNSKTKFCVRNWTLGEQHMGSSLYQKRSDSNDIFNVAIKALLEALRGWRKFQPGTFQPQASTQDFLTPDFSIIHFLTPWFTNSWLKSLWLKSLGLKCPLTQKFIAEKFMVEKSGIERSGVEAWGRDIHIECSKQFKLNSYFYVSGQSQPFWAALKLL